MNFFLNRDNLCKCLRYFVLNLAIIASGLKVAYGNQFASILVSSSGGNSYQTPTLVNFGDLTSGNSSYEFHITAIKLGRQATLAGNSSFAIRLEQWNNTGVFGLTRFGVSDYRYAPVQGKNVNSIFGTPVHVVVTNNPSSNTSKLFIDGVYSGSWGGSFLISGDTYLMSSSNSESMASGSVLHSWATYSEELSDQQVLLRYNSSTSSQNPVSSYQTPSSGYSTGGGNYQTSGGDYSSGSGGYSSAAGGYSSGAGGYQSGSGSFQTGGGNYQTSGGDYTSPGIDITYPSYQTPSGNYQSNSSEQLTPEPILRPVVRTIGHQHDQSQTILSGEILQKSESEFSEIEVGFLISTQVEMGPASPSAQKINGSFSNDGLFTASYRFASQETLYFKAFAENKIGISYGNVQKISIPKFSSNQELSPSHYALKIIENGSLKMDGGWTQSPWFGSFKAIDNGWIYHSNLGWLYLFSDHSNGIWMWSQSREWLWMTKELYPFLYQSNIGNWIYFFRSSEGQNHFFNYSSNYLESILP